METLEIYKNKNENEKSLLSMIENKEEKERPLFTSKLTCNTSFFFFLPLLFRYIEYVDGIFFFFFFFPFLVLHSLSFLFRISLS